jgi:hypothetical protein
VLDERPVITPPPCSKWNFFEKIRSKYETKSPRLVKPQTGGLQNVLQQGDRGKSLRTKETRHEVVSLQIRMPKAHRSLPTESSNSLQ